MSAAYHPPNNRHNLARMKGQQPGGNAASNGPKDLVNEDEFDGWRTTAHQGYGAPMSANNMAADPYMSSYYGVFPQYQGLGLGEGAWSNGGDPITFLSGYGTQLGSAADSHSHYMDSMLGGGAGGFSAGFGQPAGFNYFHSSGDYSAWSATPAGLGARKHSNPYDEYGVYREQGGYSTAGGIPTPDTDRMEQSMQNLSVSDGTHGQHFGAHHPPQHGGKSTMDAATAAKTGIQLMDKEYNRSDNAHTSPAQKKTTWASIASQPAKQQPKIKPKSIPPAPMLPGKHNMDIGTWETKNGTVGVGKTLTAPPVTRTSGWSGQRTRGAAVIPAAGNNNNNGAGVVVTNNNGSTTAAAPTNYPNANPTGPGQSNGSTQPPPVAMASQNTIPTVSNAVNSHADPHSPAPSSTHPLSSAPLPTAYGFHPVLEKLRSMNEYNPPVFDVNPKNVRFFIIKSYSEDDIHRSIKYGIWCSTEHGNKRLDQAFRDQDARGGIIYLFYSVNGSGHFCGMAQMTSPLDYHATSNVWAQDKWKGEFKVKWVYVKDVPNAQLRHIRLENNENKPVTNSRDTQEVPLDKGKQVLKIIHTFKHTTSIFDDFTHYEKRQEEEDMRRHVPEVPPPRPRRNN